MTVILLKGTVSQDLQPQFFLKRLNLKTGLKLFHEIKAVNPHSFLADPDPEAFFYADPDPA